MSDDTTTNVRAALERVMSTYGELDVRFSGSGGLGSVLGLYEQLRHELDRVSYDDLDRLSREIKTIVDTLLQMDFELRKVNNLKLAFDGKGRPGEM